STARTSVRARPASAARKLAIGASPGQANLASSVCGDELASGDLLLDRSAGPGAVPLIPLGRGREHLPARDLSAANDQQGELQRTAHARELGARKSPKIDRA